MIPTDGALMKALQRIEILESQSLDNYQEQLKTIAERSVGVAMKEKD